MDYIREYYKNGNIEWEIPGKSINHRRFKREGEAKQFWEDGKLKMTRTYVHGEPDGQEVLYRRDGITIWQTCDYSLFDKKLRDGELTKKSYVHGYFRTYYENGKMAVEVPFVKGEKKGIVRKWDNNGNLTREKMVE